MKKLGAYIGDSYSNLEKNTFVWYAIARRLTAKIDEEVYDISIWNLKNGYPDVRKPDATCSTTTLQSIEKLVIPMKEVQNKYCIVWDNCNWMVKDCTVLCDYRYGHEFISTLKVDQFGSNNYSHWEWGGYRAMSILKNATVNRIYYRQELTFPDVIKKELEKFLLNSCYGIGGFTTNPDPFKVVKIAEKEIKTMTETDSFLKNLNGITITSTYSKLDCGIAKPYYIYYPEMEITEDMADTLLTVLLMAKREYIYKVVFNPEKGTTTISKSVGDPVTVRCRDGEFDYILGYEMARTKMYLGSDDYNWFNKIKNHRKTHIEYTEKKTKKGGKK